jgi:hypothetical protein
MGEARQRIVINFDNKIPGKSVRPYGRRRWPKVLAFLAVAFVLVIALFVAGTFFWWQRYQTRPAYSLALMIDAARRDDTAALEQLIDTDKITANLINELSDKAVARYGAGLSPSERQRVQALMPGLLPEVRRNVRVESTKAAKDVAALLGDRPFLLLALAAPYLVTIEVENDSAVVSIPGSGTQFTMVQNGNRWQVVALKDEQTVQTLVDRLTAGLPPVGQFFADAPRGQPPKQRRRRRR